jgi:septal ring factor EnvC (AmiA/AmiB activator)
MTLENAIEAAIGLVTLAGILVTMGRVLERQKVHDEQLKEHGKDIAELKDGHGESRAAFEALRGELKGLKAAISTLGTQIAEFVARLDRHLEKD